MRTNGVEEVTVVANNQYGMLEIREIILQPRDVYKRQLLKSKYDSVLQEAEKEAEVIKKNKMLEVKEKFLHLKADLASRRICIICI